MKKIIESNDLERVKNYLRIDTDLDDIDIKTNIETARIYLKNAIGKRFFDYSESLPDEEKELINQTILMYVNHLYSSHSGVSEARNYVMPYGMQSLILQLKANYLLYEKEQEDAKKTDEK